MGKIRGCSASAAQASAYHVVTPSSLTDQSSTFLLEEIIVSEILPRLHVKLVYQFKCVSKRYECIISGSKFARYYLRRATSSPESASSSGIAVSLLFPFTYLPPFQDLFSKNVNELDPSIRMQYPNDRLSIHVSTLSLPFGDVRGNILGSSNGLILSSIYPNYEVDVFKFSLCVSNPLTKLWVRLPDPPIGNDYVNLEFGIATRRCNDHLEFCGGAAFLTYKVVVIQRRRNSYYGNAIVESFCSDTRNWDARKVHCPEEVFDRSTQGTGFSHKGILHWLDRATGIVVTYNPFDTPDQFGQIRLPERKDCSFGMKKRNKNKSLIYLGEEEVLKFCEIDSGCAGDRLTVWRLLWGSSDPEWCLEGEFSVPSLYYGCKRLMVAPYPWNRDVICHPFVRFNKVTTINPRTGTRTSVDVFSETARPAEFSFKYASYGNKLVPIEFCPWSSP